MGLDFLKKLFGEDGKTALTFDEFKAAAEKANLDLADLSGGEYISKGKYDRVVGERDKYKKQIDEDLKPKLSELQNKGSSDEQLKKELETAKQELAKAKGALEKRERLDYAMQKMGGDKKLAKLLVMEASEMVSDDVDFETAVEKVIKDQKDVFSVQDKGGDDGSKETATVKTPGSNDNGTAKPKGDALDKAVLRAFGLPDDTEIPKK